jgi:hypothetical protein
MKKVCVYDQANGPDIPQGDLLLTALGHPVFKGRFSLGSDELSVLKEGTGTLRLLEGEATGHHHEIVYGSKHLAFFRDDALARDLAAASSLALGTARLVQDRKLLDRLINGGFASPDRPWRLRDLHIGFLLVEGGSVDLVHPEHDTWRLPDGIYYCGRQVESAGAEERAVTD